jgi:hypothetical protein
LVLIACLLTGLTLLVGCKVGKDFQTTYITNAAGDNQNKMLHDSWVHSQYRQHGMV